MTEEDTTTETAPGMMPASHAAAYDALNTLGTMTTSTEFERAAIVYALCAPLPGKRSDLSLRDSRSLSGTMSFQDLADRKCHGLTHRGTVSGYWHKWADQVAAGNAVPTRLAGPYQPPRDRATGELIEWTGYRDLKKSPPPSTALVPTVVPVAVVAAEPGTPRWRELVRMGLHPVTEWEPGDAATEVFPPSYVGASALSAQCARNLELYSHETSRSLDELGARWEVSVRWPVGTRVDECTWSAHRELRHNPSLLRPGMTRADASRAAHEETTSLIHAAIVAASDGFDVMWDEDRPFTGERDLPFRLYQLDVLRGWAGRHQALAEGGKEAYWAYVSEHPFPFDLWSAEYGDPIPATDKYKRERARRPGPLVGGDGEVPR